MYDAKYAKQWLRFESSGKDVLRIKHIHPFMRESLACFAKDGSKILDVGCGWGDALKFIPRARGFEYLGIDPDPYFLDYVRNAYPSKEHRKVSLMQGSLPSHIPAEDCSSDIVLCSMALHCAGDLEASIETLFSKAKTGGKVAIADFNDAAEKVVRGAFLRIDAERKDYARGLYWLSDEVKLIAEVYFHKQKEIEDLLKKHGRFSRELLGPLFVGYTIRKNR
jgi:ubiquinone/menaquinone biosynthesis C-methylase UbiE